MKIDPHPPDPGGSMHSTPPDALILCWTYGKKSMQKVAPNDTHVIPKVNECTPRGMVHRFW